MVMKGSYDECVIFPNNIAGLIKKYPTPLGNRENEYILVLHTSVGGAVHYTLTLDQYEDLKKQATS